MATKFVKRESCKMFKKVDGDPREPKDVRCHLLWGDRVRILSVEGRRSKVRARGRLGWVDNSALGNKSLLELYFIDVGQGDGILIRTPDGRHILVDGGFPRKNNATGKNAADFVHWKFRDDYEAVSYTHLTLPTIHLV